MSKMAYTSYRRKTAAGALPNYQNQKSRKNKYFCFKFRSIPNLVKLKIKIRTFNVMISYISRFLQLR